VANKSEKIMDRKTFGIGFFSITALLLLAAVWFVPQPADAMVAIKERDYQLVTARIQTGGDALYIMDNRTGQMAVFSYDPASRTVRARTVRQLADAFGAARQ
jgi:hypothetical protein